jgi:hypothetical protein
VVEMCLGIHIGPFLSYVLWYLVFSLACHMQQLVRLMFCNMLQMQP